MNRENLAKKGINKHDVDDVRKPRLTIRLSTKVPQSNIC
jgi:hypothetical protein